MTEGTTTTAQMVHSSVPYTPTPAVSQNQGNWDQLAILVIEIGEIIIGAASPGGET